MKTKGKWENPQFVVNFAANSIMVKKLFQVIFGVLLLSIELGAADPPVKPHNVILLIGDGMGLAQVTAAMYDSKKEFVMDKFPVVGFQKCHSVDNIISESAANATAMACGVKTLLHKIGVDEFDRPCKTILEDARDKGLATGIVVTSALVHATPAAFFAHQPSRTMYEEIAEDFAKANVDFAIGGGKRYFDRRGGDDRNLLQELHKRQVSVYDYYNDDLNVTVPSPKTPFLYLTADNQPIAASQGRDYLYRAVKMALGYLPVRSKKGFFLMIEGSQIDWGGHSNQVSLLLSEMDDFLTAVEVVLAYAKQKGNTLVIVTGDHETGGLAINPGSTTKRLELKFTTNGHTATMIPVYAFGPGAEYFNGVYDNTAINHRIKELMGWKDNVREAGGE
jgi:alkaline phosphatase